MKITFDFDDIGRYEEFMDPVDDYFTFRGTYMSSIQKRKMAMVMWR